MVQSFRYNDKADEFLRHDLHHTVLDILPQSIRIRTFMIKLTCPSASIQNIRSMFNASNLSQFNLSEA
jgi:hypothetical protein